MAKQAAPVSLTGGSGFNYEDHVAARFLVDMLSGIASFGAEFGTVSRIDWQVRDTGRLLDDLSITLDGAGAGHKAAISVKSHRQVTSAGFPANFTEAAWEEWLQTETTGFRVDRDLMVLVTGQLADAVAVSWNRLLREARATAVERLKSRLQRPANPESGSQASKTTRSLFESLHCPDDLKDRGQSDDDVTVKLLRRTRLLHMHFESDPSRHKAAAELDCRNLLTSGDLDTGNELWKALIGIAAEYRGLGGSLDLSTLLSELPTSFQLIDHPDFRSDWASLDRSSGEVLGDIRTLIGDGPEIDRQDELQQLESNFETASICLAVGESGAGKSALAKSLGLAKYESVVALMPEDFEFDRMQPFESHLGLAHPIGNVLSARRDQCLFIIDSAERLSVRGRRLLARMIREFSRSGNSSHVHFLLPMHHDAVSGMSAILAEAGIDGSQVKLTTIECPSIEEIRKILLKIPGVPWATLSQDMQPLLRNLKVLDWVVMASRSGNVLDGSITGLLPLIDFLWVSWVEAEDRGIAGSGLLKKIATLEGETLISGVPLTALEHAEQQTLQSLIAANLLRKRSERAVFTHDLLSDWARLRVLIGEDPTRSEAGIERCGQPRWKRAIRLFGRWLLLRSDGVQRWSEAITRCENHASYGTHARDLLLESVMVSENSGSLFAQAWPRLTDDNGRLLKLLLDRFVFVATIPDQLYANLQEGKRSPQAEAAYRVPLWPYWSSLLKVLHERVDDACRYVPGETARICNLWLEQTPVELTDGNPFPWRVEAAKLALAVAREFQARNEEDGHTSSKDRRSAFEAALLSAHELPEEVPQFSLEVAKRRPLSPRIRERAEAAQAAEEERREQHEREYSAAIEELKAHQSNLPVFERGPLRKQWPDGPSEHVDSAFRKAVLNGNAVLPLGRVKPDVAVELLLAVCIEAPYYESSFGSDSMDDFGLASWREHRPAMYFRGPFLQFLRTSPSHGFDFVIRLTNFATSRWVVQQERRRRRRGLLPFEFDEDEMLSVSVAVNGESKSWLGDRRVFRWYLDWPVNCPLLQSVLMAVEKWFYEQIDAKKNVEDWFKLVLERSESVAFAGLLIDIGRRHPDFFLQALKPLLGVSAFYHWEPRIQMDRAAGLVGLMGWHNETPQLFKLARNWHEMPHRSHELRRIAAYLMMHSPEMDSYFAECRKGWSKEEGFESNVGLRLLVALLDRTNYESTPTEDGKVRVEFVQPAELSKVTEEVSQRADESMSAMSFPLTCRHLLEGEKELEEDDCPAFWEAAQRIADQKTDGADDQRQKAAAVTGAIAVLMHLHPNWLEADSARLKWCLNQLQSVDSNPPPRREFDTPDTPGGWDWDRFVAEAGVYMLSVAPKGHLGRSLVADGVAAYHFGTTETTMRQSFRLRQRLGEEFAVLKGLVIRWSVIRRLWSESQNHFSELKRWHKSDAKDLELAELCQTFETEADKWSTEFDKLIDTYVQGESEFLSLGEASRIGSREVERMLDLRYPARNDDAASASAGRNRFRRRHRMHRKDIGIDVRVIQAGFSWLTLESTGSPRERKDALDDINELLQLVVTALSPIKDGDDDERGTLPDDFDRWVFGIVAKCTALCVDGENTPELWNPILSLGTPGKEWVEQFYWDWFTDGLQAAPSADAFVSRWVQMVEFALDSPLWDPQQVDGFELEKPVCEFLGFDFGLQSIAADPRGGSIIEGMATIFPRIVDRWFCLPDVVNGFCRALSIPAYDTLLCRGIRWLNDAMDESDEYRFWRGHEIEENLIAALHRCWENHRDAVRDDQDLRTAFLALLMALESRGSHAAMALREQVVDSIPDAR